MSEGVPSPTFRQPHMTPVFSIVRSSGHPERSRKKLVAPLSHRETEAEGSEWFSGLGVGCPKVRQVSPCPVEATGREGSSFIQGPGKESACNAGDLGLIPGSRRSPREGNGYPLQYSCWRMPWTEEPGWLQSMGSQKVGHNLVRSEERRVGKECS